MTKSTQLDTEAGHDNNEKEIKNLCKKVREMLTIQTECERFAFEAPNKKVSTVFATVGFVFFIIYFCIAWITIKALVSSQAILLTERRVLFGAIGMALLNLIIIVKSIRRLRYINRYSCYYAMLRFKRIERIESLAEFENIREGVVKRDLHRAIKECLIPQGHFCQNDSILILSDNDFDDYIQHKAIYDSVFREIKEGKSVM